MPATDIAVKVSTDATRSGLFRTLLNKIKRWIFFSKLKSKFFPLFLVYVGKGVVPFITTLKEGLARQPDYVAKVWFLMKELLFIFASRVWGSDIIILDDLHKITAGNVSGVINGTLIRMEMLFAIIVIYATLYSFVIPIVRTDLSLSALFTFFMGYNKEQRGFTYYIFILFLLAPFLYLFAMSNGVKDYYPYQGVVEWFKMLFSNPKLLFIP